MLPKVFTDGSCLSENGQRLAGIGVFWEEGSVNNIATCCKEPPFTNNRAEYEAILVALSKANELGIKKLLVYSDSKNSVNTLNTLHCKQQKGVAITDLSVFTGSQALMANKDLIHKIWSQLICIQAYFLYIPRILNGSADALSRYYWVTRRQQDYRRSEEYQQDSESELEDSISEGEEEASSTCERIVQISELANIEGSSSLKTLINNINFSCSLQRVFSITTPSELEELAISSITTEENINIPQVPVLDSRQYLDLITQMPALQQADPDVSSLLFALRTQQPLGLSPNMGNFYPNAFVSSDSSMVWVRHQFVDKILVPEAAQLPLTELMHSSPHFGSYGGIAPTLQIIKRLFI